MKKIYYYSGAVFLVIILFLVGFILLLPGDGISSKNIALINIDGTITSQTSETGLFSEFEPSVNDYIEWIDDAEKDSNIKAIIIKINSPGGEVIASEKLSRKIKEASEEKVVVAYIETMGTSAAYQAASSTDYILAEKQALVGNIGVRMEILHYYGLMEKLGINVTTIKSGTYKDIMSPTRPMTEEEQKMIESIVDESYYEFVSWVAENRNMTINETLEVADGKIYSGIQAEKVGLVDMTGTEGDAIDIASKMANITNPEVYVYGGSSSVGIFGMTFNDALCSFGYGLGRGLSQSNMEESFKSYQIYY
ncbi:signal peptide peptidase SppA [Methanococcus maripaludis]|uniref:Protease-4 n=2 Tax=Methanococcus maripaludis TaxID=39152 RepID=A0A7J9PKM1_METMI|nr:signal peptide peptidase SppA [Methanococcus maripaludis]MBA2862099.1 protease-4 [Methanococcus maripaludis]